MASNVSYMLHRNRPVDYKIYAVMEQCVYGTKICDILDLQKCLTQTWIDFDFDYVDVLSVMIVSPAKTAEPIDMPFGLRSRMGPGTTYYRGSRSPVGRGNFEGAANYKVRGAFNK